MLGEIAQKDFIRRVQSEAAQHGSELHFRRLLDKLPAGAYTCNSAGLITYFNQQAMQLWGRAPKLNDPIDRFCGSFKLFSSDGSPIAHNRCWMALALQDVKGYNGEEIVIERPNAERRTVLAYANPITDESGALLGAVNVLVDITERKHMEEDHQALLAQEQAARTEAETANRLKDEFLATVSHELRTPLNAILGWARMVGSHQLDEEEKARAIETIERNARSQAQIIEDLLDISRITSGKLQVSFRAIDVAPVIEGAIDSLRLAAEAKNIRVNVTLDRDAGQVTGDPERLQQIVWNLLSNAIKFTPKNGQVKVRLERVESHIEITVSDTGQGISPTFLPYVFDRFRQGDSSSSRLHGGLGLGLAIVRHLVESHGGAVSATSEGEGQGAVFTVALPLRVIKESAAIKNKAAEDSADKRGSFGPLRTLAGFQILVVDDEADACKLLSQILTRHGAQVMTCDSAAEALETLQRMKPNLLISDIGMPVEDGYEFIRKVRLLEPQRGGQVPAIALTAYARVEDRVRALSAGFQMFVPKPVEPAELIDTVASLVRLSRKK